jgi:hypothetical protein
MFYISVYLTTLLLAGCLIWSEVKYFISPPHKLAFLPDTDFEAKLQINVDMTIAMPCDCKLAFLFIGQNRFATLLSF